MKRVNGRERDLWTIFLMAGIGLWALVLLWDRVQLIYSYNFNIEGVEELFGYLILKIRQGQLYSDPEKFPFIVTQYPPIYLYLTELFSHLSRYYAEDPARAMYIAARWFNLACNLFTAGLIFDFFRRDLRFRASYAFLAGLAAFQLFISHHLALRPDSLKVLFVIWMYAAFFRVLRNPTWKARMVLIVVTILALLTKQDALTHVMGLAPVLLLKGRYRATIEWIAVTGLVCSAVLLWITGGHVDLIVKNFAMGIAQGVSWDWFGRIVQWNYPAMFLLPVLVLGLLYWLYRRQEWAWMLGIVIICCVHFMSVLKWGSNFNYLTEIQILLVLFGLWRVFLQPGPKAYLPMILVLGVFYGSNHIHNYQYFNEERETGYEKDYREMIDARNRFRALAGSIEGDARLITFDRPLSLLLNEYTFFGTLVNEYPEIFFETEVHKLPSVPHKSFSYRLKCPAPYTEHLYYVCREVQCVICRENLCQLQIRWLQKFMEPPHAFSMVPVFRSGTYVAYEIMCDDDIPCIDPNDPSYDPSYSPTGR